VKWRQWLGEEMYGVWSGGDRGPQHHDREFI